MFETMFDPQGNRRLEALYKNGKEHGISKVWFANGNRKAAMRYDNGSLHGVSQMWYESGKRHQWQRYAHGKPHGTFKYWYKNGTLATVETYRNGIASGPDRGWYPDGKKMFDKFYQNGIAHGPVTAWYENGARQWAFTLDKGRLHGRYTRWYRNGKPHIVGMYQHGIAHGPWKAWHANGKQSLHAHYTVGTATMLVSHHTNGIKKSELTKPGTTLSCWSRKAKPEDCGRFAADKAVTWLRHEAKDRELGGLDSLSDAYIVRLAAYKDELCACRSAKCAHDVDGEMDSMYVHVYYETPVSPTPERHLKSIGREIGACRKALKVVYKGIGSPNETNP